MINGFGAVPHAHTGWPPIMGPFLYALPLPNINRFSTLFHCQDQEKIRNNTITKDPTTPQVAVVCVATLPCEMLRTLQTA